MVGKCLKVLLKNVAVMYSAKFCLLNSNTTNYLQNEKYESQNENNVSVSGSIKSDHAVTSLQDWIRLNQEQPKISKVG